MLVATAAPRAALHLAFSAECNPVCLSWSLPTVTHTHTHTHTPVRGTTVHSDLSVVEDCSFHRAAVSYTLAISCTLAHPDSCHNAQLFDWHSVGIFYSFEYAGQHGNITRLLACSEEQQKVYPAEALAIGPTFVHRCAAVGAPIGPGMDEWGRWEGRGGVQRSHAAAG